MHLLWFSFLVPPVVMGTFWFPSMRRPLLWKVLLGGSLLAVAYLIAGDLIRMNAEGSSFSVNRMLFVLVSITEVPLLASVVASLMGNVMTFVSCCRAKAMDIRQEPAIPDTAN